MSLSSGSTSWGSPRVEISDISISTSDELKSIDLSIGSFKQTSPCLLGTKAHKIVLSSPCQVSPSDPLILRVNYRSWKKLASKNQIYQRELLEKAGPQYVGRQEWSKSYDKVNVVLGLTVSPPSADRSTSAGSSTSDLRPTTDAIFKLVDRFRVLVIGKTGAGKSSLINRCFGVTEAAVSEYKAGISDINTAIMARENGRFVLHDSQGFEPGEDRNFQTVVNFLKARKNMPDVKDQVHAVWLCFPVPLSADERLFERGVEEFFRMKATGELGPVPIITIFTKYDTLVDEIEYSRDFRNRTRALDKETRSKLLIEETNTMFQELCVLPFERVVGSDIPHIAVSTNEEYKETSKTLRDLVKLTADYVKQCLSVEVAEEVAVLSAVAQRINPAVKIDAVIAVGKKRYWRGLASSANFPGKTLEACLQVLHADIVRIWNIQDDFAFLESKEFKALMMGLVGEQYDKLANPNIMIPASLSMLGSLAGILAACAGPAVPIVLPIAASLVVAKWAYDVYKQSQLTLQRLMAYIVDLTIIMQIIFGLVVNAQLRLSRRLIKLAFTTFSESRERVQVHNEIKEHVKHAGRADRDAALAKILQLIESYRMKSEDMEELQSKMAGFANIEDEPWVVPHP